VITSDEIDCNQHVSEASYYSIGVKLLQQLHQEYGFNDLFDEHRVAPVVFNTRIDFKHEVFEGEEVEIAVTLSATTEDFRKWQRTFEITNSEGKRTVEIVSDGAFFDLDTRKVTAPPKAIFDAFHDSDLVANSSVSD
jgi:acyl-CoA thioester hydrolase